MIYIYKNTFRPLNIVIAGYEETFNQHNKTFFSRESPIAPHFKSYK